MLEEMPPDYIAMQVNPTSVHGDIMDLPASPSETHQSSALGPFPESAVNRWWQTRPLLQNSDQSMGPRTFSGGHAFPAAAPLQQAASHPRPSPLQDGPTMYATHSHATPVNPFSTAVNPVDSVDLADSAHPVLASPAHSESQLQQGGWGHDRQRSHSLNDVVFHSEARPRTLGRRSTTALGRLQSAIGNMFRSGDSRQEHRPLSGGYFGSTHSLAPPRSAHINRQRGVAATHPPLEQWSQGEPYRASNPVLAGAYPTHSGVGARRQGMSVNRSHVEPGLRDPYGEPYVAINPHSTAWVDGFSDESGADLSPSTSDRPLLGDGSPQHPTPHPLQSPTHLLQHSHNPFAVDHPDSQDLGFGGPRMTHADPHSSAGVVHEPWQLRDAMPSFQTSFQNHAAGPSAPNSVPGSAARDAAPEALSRDVIMHDPWGLPGALSSFPRSPQRSVSEGSRWGMSHPGGHRPMGQSIPEARSEVSAFSSATFHPTWFSPSRTQTRPGPISDAMGSETNPLAGPVSPEWGPPQCPPMGQPTQPSSHGSASSASSQAASTHPAPFEPSALHMSEAAASTPSAGIIPLPAGDTPSNLQQQSPMEWETGSQPTWSDAFIEAHAQRQPPQQLPQQLLPAWDEQPSPVHPERTSSMMDPHDGQHAPQESPRFWGSASTPAEIGTPAATNSQRLHSSSHSSSGFQSTGPSIRPPLIPAALPSRHMQSASEPTVSMMSPAFSRDGVPWGDQMQQEFPERGPFGDPSRELLVVEDDGTAVWHDAHEVPVSP